MADTIEALKNQANNLRHSSNFTAGDPGSFMVPIIRGKVELPGKYDPATYYERLELKKVSSVGVVFPGNGGLCAEAIDRGAKFVWAIEPRNQFARSLVSVSNMLMNAGKGGLSFIADLSIAKDATGNGRFDTVIWPEGLEQVTDPVESLQNVYSTVKPGGSLYIEVTHGNQEIPQGSVNSWRPKEEAFVKLINALFGDVAIRAMVGRLEKRIIYQITRPVPKTIDVQVQIQAPAVTEITQEVVAPKKPKAVRAKRQNLLKKVKEESNGGSTSAS